MASILKVGSSWRALIRRAGRKPICKTFPSKAQAGEWARRIESQLDAGKTPAEGGATVAEVLRHYRKLRDTVRPILDTANEHYMLKHLETGLGHIRAEALTTDDLLGWCQARADAGAGPYCLNMELSKLGTALRYAGEALKLDLPDVVGRARPVLSHMGLIGGGGKRERRATDDEIERIMSSLKAPYADAVLFLVFSTLRRGEMCRITWADVDAEKQCVMVRDRKHPRKKKGNDELVPMTNVAWGILQRQPKVSERIFPIHTHTMSRLFKLACDAHSIPDLHLHDLRHEGTTRLFENGYAIQEVALFTGHKDWRNLRRYTNLDPAKVRKA